MTHMRGQMDEHGIQDGDGGMRCSDRDSVISDEVMRKMAHDKGAE